MMTNDSVVLLLICTHNEHSDFVTGSSDTDVVFREVDLNHDVAAIQCFLFLSACLR